MESRAWGWDARGRVANGVRRKEKSFLTLFSAAMLRRNADDAERSFGLEKQEVVGRILG